MTTPRGDVLVARVVAMEGVVVAMEVLLYPGVVDDLVHFQPVARVDH